eukprot:m.40245 g.40245  ORF g.40245 m.40245 type:complete len:885 (+) comp14094_c0_seq1:109-2763(+)
MSDAKYFSSSKKGEIFELKQALKSAKKAEKRDAVKKVIASMTVGKDVSSLFSDVINCIQTDNLELKKLVYLYLMNYAKTQPDLAIMAVNTFVKDCVDPNPLIRALAVRTMGCIRVDKITEYLCDPLRKCLKDEDPYVRKTAAVCVAKLYDIDPTLVEEQGFVDALQDLLCDANPMVVANAVAALSEINEYSTSGQLFDINSGSVSKLLTALNECTEWGQVFILDSLAVYEPRDQRELQSICERVAPRLQHVNAAVVLSAVKVLMKSLGNIQDQDYRSTLVKKLAPPLVTLLSSEPEVQYVALRNINLIVQKHPHILSQHMKVFFVKYNDPIYVKLEKLDVMIRLASDANIQEVLAELKEYATEVDVDFVRKSVRAIGRCAIKVEGSAQRCVDTLLELIQTKVNYVVQEAIVVIKDIFRKYPNKYEGIIATLCENLDSLDESEAKAAMIWIVGEYAERIDNADELLDSFLTSFTEEPSQVQLQLLTAIVKLFVKRPSGTQDLVQKVLGLSTQESDNPDLRDRGYIYWRLLLTDPAAAKAVVLCEKPLISEETDLLEPSLLDELLCHISSLASVYHKPPSTFVEGRVPGRRIMPKALLGDDELDEPVDLLGLDLGEGAPAAAASAAAGGGGGAADLLGGHDVKNVPTAYVPAKEVWISESKGQGMELQGSFARRGGQMFMELTFSNRSGSGPMSEFAIQFNKNSFGLNPASALEVPTLAKNASHTCSLPLNTLGAVQRMEPLSKLQVAVKFTAGSENILYFSCNVPFHIFFVEDGKVDKSEYLSTWKEIGDDNEVTSTHNNQLGSSDQIAAALDANNIFAVAKRTQDGQEMLYLSLKFCNNILVFAELTLSGINAVQLALKSKTTDVIPGVQKVFDDILAGGSSEA